MIVLFMVLGGWLGAVGPRGAAAATAPLTPVWSRQPAGAPFATVDTAGNVLTAETATPAGIVVTKYAANGTPLWTQSLSDTNAVLAIATDPRRNVLVASRSTLTSLSSDGFTTNFTKIPAAPILSMAVDPSGNVVLAENDWFSDLILEKFSASGAPVSPFPKTFSSTGGFEDLSLAVDSAGNIIVAAAYEGGTIEGGTIEVGTINFGGGPLTTPYLDSMILAKLTPSGSHLFSKIFKPTVAAGGTYAGIYKIRAACDSKNNIVTTGTIDGVGKFVMGGKNITLRPPGEETMFLAKFLPTGSTSFAMAIGTDGVFVEALAIDTANNILATGENGSLTFLGGVDGAFVAKFSSTGSYRSGRIVASPSATANSIAVDRTHNNPVAAGSDYPFNYLLKLTP